MTNNNVNVNENSQKSEAYKALNKSVAPNLRSQIVKLHRRDGLTVEEISTVLELSSLLIQAVIYCATPASDNKAAEVGLKTRDEVDSEYQELLGAAKDIESKFAYVKDAAIETLAELHETAESEAVRYNSAKSILEICSGKLRPERPTKQSTGGITPADMQSFIQQAMAIHTAAIAANGQLKSATPSVEVQTVVVS